EVQRRVDDLDDFVQPDDVLIGRLAGGLDAEQRAARALEIVRRLETFEDADRAADRDRRFFRLFAQQADVEQQARLLVRRVELLERRARRFELLRRPFAIALEVEQKFESARS